jgi:cobalt/nickel transport protein
VSLLLSSSAFAHFGTILPSDDIITQADSMTVEIQLKFIHPMEQHYMEMARPKVFGVMTRGKVTDLLESLRAAKGQSADQDRDFTYWLSDFQIKRPGDYTFFFEPQPYWEPAEDLFIVHYTKVCVNALGLESHWDQPVGLETEIVPLSRPYGLWTNNLFTGQVLLKGQPVPFVEVEVEYLNESDDSRSMIVPPADPYVTQVVKADANGVFHYAMPRAGWWGFSALSEAEWTLPHAGQEKSVEIGAVYWVHTRDMY